MSEKGHQLPRPSLAGAAAIPHTTDTKADGLRGTPSAIVDKLAMEVAKILSDPQVKARADAAGLYPATSTPAEFAAFIQHEAARWPTVAKNSGMHFD
jgi:hypothetical protein